MKYLIFLLFITTNISFSQAGFYMNHKVESKKEIELYKKNDTLSDIIIKIPKNETFGANGITYDSTYLYVEYLNKKGFVKTRDVEISSLGMKILKKRFLISQNQLNSWFRDDIKTNIFSCDEILYKKDKFTEEENYRTPSNSGVYLIKSIKKGVEKYFLSIYVSGLSYYPNEKGIYVLFDNEKKIILPNHEIDVLYNDKGWLYNGVFELSKEAINLISNNLITDVKLYIFEKEISLKDSESISEYFKCLQSK